jgi:hypothetical protein
MTSDERVVTGANIVVKFMMSGILTPPHMNGPFLELAGIEGR